MAYGWEGKRIRLAPIEKARHFEHVIRWLNDPDLTARTLVGDFPVARLAEEAWFDRITSAGTMHSDDVVLAVETLDGVFIGICGIHQIEWRHGVGKTGTLIGPAEYRGKGYGSEAVILRTRYAFEVLGLRMLISEVFEDNSPMMRVLEKAGYHRVAVIPRRHWKRGQFRDMVVFLAERHA